MDNYTMRSKRKKPGTEGLRDTTYEYFRSNNKRSAQKHIKKNLETDAQKVANGSHKWIKEGKTTKLVRIQNPV